METRHWDGNTALLQQSVNGGGDRRMEHKSTRTAGALRCKLSSADDGNCADASISKIYIRGVKIVIIFSELMTLCQLRIKSCSVSSWTYLTLSLSGRFFFHFDHKNTLHLLLNWAQTSHFGVCSNHSSQEHLIPGRRAESASKMNA